MTNVLFTPIYHTRGGNVLTIPTRTISVHATIITPVSKEAIETVETEIINSTMNVPRVAGSVLEMTINVREMGARITATSITTTVARALVVAATKVPRNNVVVHLLMTSRL
jgi:hypothetical protein